MEWSRSRMFGFLKDKLKNALGKFSKDVEKEAVVEKKEVHISDAAISEDKKSDSKDSIVHKKEGFFQKIFAKKESAVVTKHVDIAGAALEDDTKEGDNKEIDTEKTSNNILQDAAQDAATSSETLQLHVSKKDKNSYVADSSENKERHKKRSQGEREEEKKETMQGIVVATENKPLDETTHNVIPTTSHKNIEKNNHKNELLGGVEQKHDIDKKHENTVLLQKQESGTVKESKNYDKPASSLLKKDIRIEASSGVETILKTPTIPQAEVSTEKKGFFTRITETFTKFSLSEDKFEELFWDLEVVLLENNIAVEVIDKIKSDMKQELMNGKISRKGVEELILSTLKKSIIELFDVEKIDIMERIALKRKSGAPYIAAIIGVNGSGKTTSIAKLTYLLQNKGLNVVMAASDTFRAAAIQQLEEHATRLKTKIIKHDYNSDPAAVAFDAIKYAQAHNIDVVIIDTAGRLHSNTNLMEELKKVIRVCNPDIKIFVGESITGNDCVEQAKEFDRAVGIDAIILAKADVDEKGGAAISVSYVTQKPILYLGTGQTYDDLKEFDSDLIVKSLEL
jgi:fused signal recognition particle receptor